MLLVDDVEDCCFFRRRLDIVGFVVVVGNISCVAPAADVDCCCGLVVREFVLVVGNLVAAMLVLQLTLLLVILAFVVLTDVGGVGCGWDDGTLGVTNV